MKKILCLPLLLMLFSGLALGQTKVFPCDPNHPAPNCTDYFGVANWANSPLPAGTITGFTIVASGSGYATPVVVITDPTNAAGTCAATATQTAGVITAFGAPTGGCGGYSFPQVTIVDMGPGWTTGAPTCGAAPLTACGSGALATAVLGPPFTGGIHKFQDAMPSLAIAVPDTTTFPNSDYYVIALQQYSAKMHSDLPPTTLRGYVQLNNGTAGPPPPISYLGPTIIAQKNRPVRILFKNMLPTGAGGNLFVPTDTTYMGAGAPNTQNRGELHLHGGATPWISDGTPHQWTVPAGETGGPPRGPSVQFVPDMWFDASGNLITSCAGQSTCATPGATNDPGIGSLTYFWTNQQGGRLMFYHDHAYGITRLNVYAGEAAGFLLYDPAEETALAAATVPGTITATPDLAHLIPMVIQDKTFVPSQAQLMAEDPTWAGNYGASAPTTASNGNGDLWFPHVYTTNQNPADPGGANGFGRWDYGPWFHPAQTSLTAANPPTAVTVPCTSAAFPNAVVQCPITPNPSGTPEAFMDTPVVNGKAYPELHVAPAAYRFKILSVGNDRSLNLQLYQAFNPTTLAFGTDPTATEVKMVPAVPPTTGALVPLCTAINPVTNPGLDMGVAMALLDATGDPLNGTGLPAGCWPNYGASAGIPIQQTMWAADGRAGGVPDPATAGPPIIQIGTEGGLLPAPVVIPSTPTGFEANTRSITITNVSVHGLWLGPAERADVIVDFSKFGGKTLILYNDAPTPAPAIDSRLDYFTGDADQTPIGGAPSTQPGYGPNTRTIMRIVVDQTAPNSVPFSLKTLTGALPGIFAQTQPVPIVPEPTYPPASGGNTAVASYSATQDTTFTFTPIAPIGNTVPCLTPAVPPALCVDMDQKAIQELFTLDYGRMNATLGTELKLINFTTQTTIPLGYIDPPSEIIKQGDTQLWKITHNGVDTHFIHFHLFNVQVINRMGWDGTLRPPDPNELGWKDTVRMNPLENIVVALQPITPVLPFPIRDSYRLFDVTAAPGTVSQFTNINPYTNNPQNTPNAINNFGWEYVWHCHILGHEENDMMRAISFQVPPEAPSNLVVAAAATGLNLSWTDNSASETGFTVQRDTNAGFSTVPAVTFTVAPLAPDANGQGVTYGGTLTYNDTTAAAGTAYFYRVQAFKPDASYWTAGANITSAWSNTASLGPIAGVLPSALAFGLVALNTASAPQTVTLSNTGTAAFTYTTAILGANLGDFAVTANPCAGTVPAGSNCAISVTFTPTVTPGAAESASLVIATNDPGNPTLTVSLTGTGGTAPLLTITASNATMKYGSLVPVITASYNPPNPVGLTTTPTCTTTATSTSPVGTYATTCSGAVGPFSFTYVPGTLTVTKVPLTIFAPNATMAYGGAVPTITLPSTNYVGFVAGDTTASLTTAPTCSTTATSTNTTPPGTYPITCSGAVDPNYNISYVNGTMTMTRGALTVTTDNATRVYGAANPPVTTTNVGLAVGDTLASLGIACVDTALVNSAVSPTAYPIGCVGPGFTANYATITYVNTGGLMITPAPLTITASSATMTYGGPVPAITPIYVGFVAGDTAASLTTAPTCSTLATSTSNASPPPYQSSCSGAIDTNYSITSVPGTVTINKATTSTLISSHLPNPSTLQQPVVVAFTVTPQFAGTTPIGNVTVTASGGGSCTGTVAAGNCSITFTTRGTRTLTAVYAGDTNFITSRSPGVSQTVNSPTVSIPNQINFGNQTVGTTHPAMAATVTNVGTGALINVAWSITGTNAGDFAIASTTCTAAGLAPGASCVFNITFTPSALGQRNANLTLTDNALNSPQNIALRGNGR